MGYIKLTRIEPTNHLMALHISAGPNQTNIIEMSEDLRGWQALATNSTGDNGLYWFDDPNTTSLRFYRVKKP